MHQAKISSFFHPSSPKAQNPLQSPKVIEASGLLSVVMNSNSSDLDFEDPKLASKSDFDDLSPLQHHWKYKSNVSSSSCPSRNLSKKRIYEQYHLDLGQSDFMLHTCSVCGLMYTRGVDEDEKFHRKLHVEYDRGIQFKGWNNERVVSGPWCNGDRILLILDTDPSTQKRMVQKAVNLVKKEIGFINDQITHSLCKVLLYISAHRIVGWLVAEPIQTAHRVISSSSSCNKQKMNSAESKKSPETALQFGNIKFRRELVKKECPAARTKRNGWDGGAVICDEEPVPAKCGVRAIWVVPSGRRKGIASRLMDAVRKNFSAGHDLDVSECAFSPPTTAGMAFASHYMKTRSFLVYRADGL